MLTCHKKRLKSAGSSLLRLASRRANENLNTNEPLKTKLELPPWGWCDTYCALMTLAFAGPGLFVYGLFTMAVLPLLLLGKLYIWLFVPRPTNRITSFPLYNILLLITFPYAAFIYFFICAYWVFVFVGAHMMAIPVALFRIVLLQQGSSLLNNFALLWPYMKANNQSYSQAATAILGEMDRQGLFKFLFGRVCSVPPGGLGTAVAFIPIIKYCWHTNVFLWVLEEVFANQWTPPVPDIDEPFLIEETRKFIARFAHSPGDRKVVRHVRFAAHYPWPHHDFDRREHVIGIQWPDHSKFVNFTNTTHVLNNKVSHDGLVGVGPKSETGKTTLCEVRLFWYQYHFLTGYVEVNYRHDKGLEHPLWCIMSSHSYLAMLSYSWVNDLFEAFVPDVVKFVERINVEEDAEAERRLGIVIGSGRRV